jgi:hypothetical protein
MAMSVKPFPEGLLSWAGHRDGGVKKPFVGSSGRPSGEVIRTRLLDKIDSWIDELTRPSCSTHGALLLIGGPGNGKTEAVEYFTERFDEKLGTPGTLVEKCKAQLAPAPGTLPPRNVSVDLRDIPGAAKINFKRLEIVHDATVGDPAKLGLSPGRLLIDDLENLNGNSELLHISCVNRGILAQALDEATSSTTKESTKNFLVAILRAVTLSAGQPSCWPLQEYPHVAVWPMDIESLVDHSAYEGGVTPAHHIFKRALDASLWIPREECPAGNLCPFHANLALLSDDAVLGNLVKILRHYEISSGKRWTFRELFSLIPQLLVGHENDFKLRGKEVDPCKWAAAQLRIAETDNDFYERTRARFLLSSRIYSHALFPRWPDLRLIKDDCNPVLKKDSTNDSNANDLFRLLGRLRRDESTSTHRIVNEQVGILLDPVEVSGNVMLADGDLTADDLEEMFSYSVKQGYSAVRECLSEIERVFMDWTVRVEGRIGEDASKGNKNNALLYDEVRKTIRSFACRFVKRSLAVKRGVTKDGQYLERYAQAIEEVVELKKARKKFLELIHVNSRFPISLTTTYGQPAPNRERDATLYTQMVKVSYIVPPRTGQHARSSLPYLKIKDHAVPLTYHLFKALVQLEEGLMEPSIPSDILALIEGTRARMAGEIVRDNEGLDDAILCVGRTRLSLTTHGGRIHVEEQT